MKVIVIAVDQHPVEGHDNDFFEERVVGTGSHLVAHSDRVQVDGKTVLKRDRRRIGSRIQGHPWLHETGSMTGPHPYTGFRVEIEEGTK